jgi:dTDP-4-amino-4,6-dideoxygalactose transaminase
LPVDLAGLPVDRERLYGLAQRHGLRVIEDAAQSMGSRHNGRVIGSIGDLSSLSFHPNKNITSIEGGCLVVNDEREARLAEQYRLQGVVRSGFDGIEVEIAGGKFNLTDVAARVGLGQLPHLARFNARRAELARLYFEHFNARGAADLGLQLPLPDFANSNWHMFQVVLPEPQLTITRAQVMERLHALGIGTGAHYPVIHLFALYRRRGFKPGDFPIAEFVGRNILTLPLFADMRDSDVPRVVEALLGVLQEARA